MTNETLGTNDRATREQHIQHEQHLRAIGTLLVGAGSFLVLLAIAGGAVLLARPESPEQTSPSPALVLFLEGSFVALCGVGLRHLQRWPVMFVYMICLFGLIVIPLGTVLSIWIVRVLLRGATSTVLSPDYRRIVAATPEVPRPRSRTPLILGLLATFQLLAFVGIYHLMLEQPPAEQAE